jgi:3-hydroxybutyrate dehydrogenase
MGCDPRHQSIVGVSHLSPCFAIDVRSQMGPHYIASAHGLVGSPFKSAYVAAKHGILGLTKVIALETAERGITCNAICPGYVYTPLVEAQIDSQAKAHRIPREQVIRDVLLAQQPNKRFATVEELGALAVFLASDAAAVITGTALPVDGGWTAH